MVKDLQVIRSRHSTYVHEVLISAVLCKVTPQGDLVLCKVAEAEQKTTGGILLPVQAQKRPTSGWAPTVVAELTLKHTASRSFCVGMQ